MKKPKFCLYCRVNEITGPNEKTKQFCSLSCAGYYRSVRLKAADERAEANRERNERSLERYMQARRRRLAKDLA